MTPGATYRLQVHAEFGLADVRALVPYLERIGVTHVYLSPITAARGGSRHGYDVVRPDRINPEIGTPDDLAVLARELHTRGMGLVVDIVPNHMAASQENPWWLDVLENGAASPYARFFDVDWHPAGVKGGLRGKLLVPILGQPYGAALESGELSLVLEDGVPALRYFDTRLPLGPRAYAPVFARAQAALAERLGAEHPGPRQLAAVLEEAAALPARPDDDEDPEHWVARRAGVKQRFAEWLHAFPEARPAAEAALAGLAGRPGVAESWDALDRVLADQPYWLAFWRLAAQEIHFRRFFNIAELVAVRVEDAAVFDATHRFVLQLAREGLVDGLRVDHIDGLWDPLQYLRRLQNQLAPPKSPFYVVVEKILARGERLPADWPAAGTTGYEFIDAVSGVQVDARGLDLLDHAYARFTGLGERFEDVRYDRKKLVVERLFGGELRSLADELARLAAMDRHGKDVPASELAAALVEVTACLPVYRTYIRDGGVPPADLTVLEEAFDDARRRADEARVSAGAFEFLRRVLLQGPVHGPPSARRARLSFTMRWQQFTGAVMAKGLEDTSFYVYNRLTSLNEVGGDPAALDGEDGLAYFHRFAAERRAAWPGALSAGSTHDTKRSEDVRARIHTLSEIPDEWAAAVRGWSALNEPHKSVVHGRPVPGPNQEWFLYQSLAGAWPLDDAERAAFPDRIAAYVLKAAREAAVRTSWMRPDTAHEEALTAFVGAILDPARAPQFVDEFGAFAQRLAYAGAVNSLAALVLRCVAPGVPDVYQGTEMWDWSLVDPDNRRPVDWARRAAALDALGEHPDATALHAAWRDGRIKLFVLARALALRRSLVDVFAQGEYVPLAAQGDWSTHVVACARRRGRAWVVAVVPRFLLSMGAEAPLDPDAWEGTRVRLPGSAPRRWLDVFTGEPLEAPRGLACEELFAKLPVALLRSA